MSTTPLPGASWVARRHPAWFVAAPIVAGLVAYGVAWLLPPVYTASTTFLPPQQQQSSNAAALASLGALAGLSSATRTPADQFVSLMHSNAVRDRLIEQLQLASVYDTHVIEATRDALDNHVRIYVGKRDGLLTVEADDRSPERAAQLANLHVAELRRLTGGLALSEAQQRRVFFEQLLKSTKESLTQAQSALQSTGFTESDVRGDPRTSSDAYARLRAELTAAEVKLQSLSRVLTDSAPEVLQQGSQVAALRQQLQRLEATLTPTRDGDYLARYREFKYEETLFELYARQFELARVDESRDNALIQVIDEARPPTRRSGPRRTVIAGTAAAAVAVLIWLGWLLGYRCRPAR